MKEFDKLQLTLTERGTEKLHWNGVSLPSLVSLGWVDWLRTIAFK